MVVPKIRISLMVWAIAIITLIITIITFFIKMIIPCLRLSIILSVISWSSLIWIFTVVAVLMSLLSGKFLWHPNPDLLFRGTCSCYFLSCVSLGVNRFFLCWLHASCVFFYLVLNMSLNNITVLNKRRSHSTGFLCSCKVAIAFYFSYLSFI